MLGLVSKPRSFCLQISILSLPCFLQALSQSHHYHIHSFIICSKNVHCVSIFSRHCLPCMLYTVMSKAFPVPGAFGLMKETDINQLIQVYIRNCNKRLILFKIGIHACQCRGYGFGCWSGRTPRASG